MKEIFTMELLTQIVGIIAMFFSVFSFQMNKHKQIMIMQIVATALFGVQYFLLGAMTGVAMDCIGVVRAIVFYHKDKKWAAWNGWTVIFMILFAVFCGFTWAGPVSLLMALAMMLNTLSFSFTNPKLVRSTILISSPLLLLYGIFTGSLGGIINEVFVEISSVVGLLRYDIKRKPKAVQEAAEETESDTRIDA